eukprot:g22549.t1
MCSLVRRKLRIRAEQAEAEVRSLKRTRHERSDRAEVTTRVETSRLDFGTQTDSHETELRPERDRAELRPPAFPVSTKEIAEPRERLKNTPAPSEGSPVSASSRLRQQLKQRDSAIVQLQADRNREQHTKQRKASEETTLCREELCEMTQRAESLMEQLRKSKKRGGELQAARELAREEFLTCRSELQECQATLRRQVVRSDGSEPTYESRSTVITGVSDDGPLTASGQARGSLRSSEKESDVTTSLMDSKDTAPIGEEFTLRPPEWKGAPGGARLSQCFGTLRKLHHELSKELQSRSKSQGKPEDVWETRPKAGEDGTSVLLKALQSSLQPRSRQEARDLYQIGAQQGGVLSRQQGESIPSYVLRRKAWYNLMLDMDSSLKLPEAILAEQTLQNSGISNDHQLLIRAAVHGDVTMEKICEELVAQHSRVHEHELRRGKGGTFGRHSNYGKSFNSKGYGKDRFRSWSRAYHVQPADEYYDCEDWESHSQSLGGYEEFDGYHVDEAYAYVNDEDEVIHSVFMNMHEEGLDEQDPEAAEYAAEVLQTEAEAFFVRDRAGQTGHRGFGGSPRHFQVQGHLTMEERKARVQALKAKTQCRKCGQHGHWANDPQCPRSYKKGKGKSSSSSPSSASTATSSPKSNKGGKGGKSDKPRTVFFTINEYSDDMTGEQHHDLEANMVMRDGREETADEALDRLIAEAQVKTLHQVNLPVSGYTPPGYTIGRDYSLLVTDERKAHLDYYLAAINDPNDPEWRDAYDERWNEFMPGHPFFNEQDPYELDKAYDIFGQQSTGATGV